MARRSRNLTYEQVLGRKDKAVRFLRDVLDDPERAGEVEAESVEDYAARRHLALSNPKRRGGDDGMPPSTPSKRELQEQVDELQEYVDELEDKLDQIADLSAPEDQEDEEEDGDDNVDDQ